MNLKKTIENIQNNSDRYVDPELVATIINKNYYMGENDINELKSYGISENDSFSEKVLKILEKEHVFLSLGMLAMAPIINECDIYSKEKYTVKLSPEEFKRYINHKDEYFGILIEKETHNIILGTCDLCGCSINASFRPLEETNDELYQKLKEITENSIVL